MRPRAARTGRQTGAEAVEVAHGAGDREVPSGLAWHRWPGQPRWQPSSRHARARLWPSAAAPRVSGPAWSPELA